MLTHLTWSMLMLRYLPPLFELGVPGRRSGRDPVGHVVPPRPAAARPPALDAAAEAGPVCALFVLDDVLLKVDNGPRTAYLYRRAALDEDLRSRGGRLSVKGGRPENVVPRVAEEIGAAEVHVSEDFAPYGAARDRRVEEALATSVPGAAGADRRPVRGLAGSGTQEGRRAVQGLHPLLPGLVGTSAGTAPRPRTRPGPPGTPSTGSTSPTTPRPPPSCPTPGEAAARRRGRSSSTGARALQRGAQPAGPRRHVSTYVGAPEVRGDPPADDARRPRVGRRGSRHTDTSLLARLLRRRSCTTGRTARTGTCQPAMARDALRHRETGRRAARGVAATAAPATRSSTPACASSPRRAGCTTACA